MLLLSLSTAGDTCMASMETRPWKSQGLIFSALSFCGRLQGALESRESTELVEKMKSFCAEVRSEAAKDAHKNILQLCDE